MIIDIPKQAVVNRIIPKNRFNFDDATKIERIRWLGKLGPTTINLPAKKIQEIEIFSIEMFDFDVRVIKEIVSKIPQEILFIISDELVIMYYQGQCISKKVENHLQIKGLSIDEVRDNFIRQLLDIKDISQPLKQQVDAIQIINELESEIDRINTQIKRTVQTNKKQELARKRFTVAQKLAKLRGE
ncbi:DUF4391 domain-containing protein [Enterococcus hirae]|uniref:DUF4391 domain-containing protein n=1 Tax=Enterococcus TaxID=1350 RepID=UPI000CF0FA94|nr:DUF4391 domain-containing protein [Enterococcus durans]EMF0177571.1 hypothetical protein [Enterococcus hirae]PQD36336.1 hypothetical protein CUM72_09110 [Enterococcus durans]